MSRYQAEYQVLDESQPLLGSVAILQWDTDVFGFPAGEYVLGDPVAALPHALAVGERLRTWISRNRVRVCLAAIPAGECAWIATLPRFGFVYVDHTVRVRLCSLETVSTIESRCRLRQAQKSDVGLIASLAARVFRHGRYHLDAQFPRQLADLRYERWIENAFSDGSDIFVIEIEGDFAGFFHVDFQDGSADIRLNALHPKFHGMGLGKPAYLAMIKESARRGARQVTSKLSSSNTKALNIYAALGFRFFDARVAFHCHAEQRSSSA